MRFPIKHVDALAEAARGVGLVPAYQPIVRLSDEAIVGFEALARWPHLASCNPADVFAHAAAIGALEYLDNRCVAASIDGALQHGLPAGSMLSINCEPQTRPPVFEDGSALVRARGHLSLVFELTERSLLTHPHALLSKVAALRGAGVAVALDDVGAHPDSLALLDIIAPDIIKLDLHLVQSQPHREQARALAAVMAHQERNGTTIIAEGIEHDEHLEQALAFGASLGQGHKYAKAGPLDPHRNPTAGWKPGRVTTRSRPVPGSPFDLLTKESLIRTGREQTLRALSRQIEDQASCTADPPIVLIALQKAGWFDATARQHCSDLAESSPLVAVFGQDLPPDLGSGIRGVPLGIRDPLCGEWTMLALGAQLAVALIARERQTDLDGEPLPKGDTQFDFTVTYDRTLVTAVARNLLNRMF